MFQTAVHEALKKQLALKTEADARAASALDNAARLSDVLTGLLNEEVREIYETQKLLETETQLLRRELSESRAAVAGWAAKLRGFGGALKEAGDLEHYLEHLAREAELLASVTAELGGRERAGGGEGWGGAAAAAVAAGEQQQQEPAGGGGGGSALPVSTGASR